MRRIAAGIFLSLTIAFASAPEVAFAQKAASEDAARLKKDGDEAFLALRYADALRAYEASYRLAANPALHYNRGRALEALERYVEAIDAYERFLREAPAELREKTAKLGEHVKSLKQKIATIDLRVSPPGARVLLRKIAVGTAPLSAPLRVNAGPATLEVEAEGYEANRRDVMLAGGSKETITVDLKPRGASLVLASKPEGASFFVDGRAQESSTVLVEPGQHVVRAVLGDESAERTITVRTGERTEVTLELERSGVLSKWWFWTAAGVVVVGAGVATYFLVSKTPEPRSGDIGSGRLSAPLLRF